MTMSLTWTCGMVGPPLEKMLTVGAVLSSNTSSVGRVCRWAGVLARNLENQWHHIKHFLQKRPTESNYGRGSYGAPLPHSSLVPQEIPAVRRDNPPSPTMR